MKYRHLIPEKSVILQKKGGYELYYHSQSRCFYCFFPTIFSLLFFGKCKAALPKNRGVFALPAKLPFRFFLQKNIEKEKGHRCFFLLRQIIVDQRKYVSLEEKTKKISLFAKVDIKKVPAGNKTLFPGELAERQQRLQHSSEYG